MKSTKRSAADSGINVMELTKIVLSVNELQIKSRMLDYAATPVFITHLKFMQSGRDRHETILFQARRSNKDWILTEVAATLAQMHDGTVLDRILISDDRFLEEASLYILHFTF